MSKVVGLIRWLQTLIVKSNSSETYQLPYTSLSPISNADSKGYYQKSLLWALKNRKREDIRNIALTGPYGSGKSSILKTFIENYKGNDFHFLPISLATFKEEEEGQDTAKKEELLRLIEISILQQIFYREPDYAIPDSRFRKIKRFKRRERILISCLLFIFAFSLTQLIYPQFLHFVFQIQFPIETLRFAHFTALVITVSLLLLFVYKSARTVSGIKISKVQIQNAAEIGFDETKNKSVLNHHLDEILYFFEVTPYNVVVIEDLDRFRQTEIFTKLREINLLINQSKKVRKDVVFIYAVRDDMFRIENERTKFFDFIIPVIPVINSSNSSDMLFQKQKEQGWSFSEDLIDSISLFIDDMRLLHNITNEYYLYHQTLDKNLSQDKLLAMLVYKNLFPNDFTALTNNAGVLYQAIQSKKKIVESRKIKLEEEKFSLKERINELEGVRLRDTKELRLIYLSHYPKHLPNFVSFYSDYNKISIVEAVEDVMFEKVKSDKISYSYFSHYSHPYFNEKTGPVTVKFSKIEKEVNSIYTYDQREAQIVEIAQNKIELIKKRIQEIDAEIDHLRFLQISELLQHEELELNIAHEEQEALVHVLLRNGFINEDYFDYISLFYEGSITHNDQQYLVHVKSQKPLPFDHSLNKLEKVVAKINPMEFKQAYVLNYQIVDFIIGESRYKMQIDNIYEQLKRGDELSMRFIDGFIGVSIKLPMFINELVKRWAGLWSYIEQKSNFTADRKHYYLKLIFAHANVSDILQLLSSKLFRAAVLERKDFLQIILDAKKLKEIIKGADLKFTELVLEDSPKELLDYVYENNHYDINVKMLQLMLAFKGSLDMLTFNSKNYLAITSSNQDKLIRYIEENIDKYVLDVYRKLLSNQEEDERELLKLLNHSDLSLQNKGAILHQVHSCIEDLSKVQERDVKNVVIEQNKIKAKWENIADIFQVNECIITDSLTSYLNEDAQTAQLVKYKMPSDEGESNLFKQLTVAIAEEDSICDSNYDQLIKAFGQRIDGLNLNLLSSSKIEMLIKRDVLFFNTNNYSSIKSDYPPLHIHFIERNVISFLNIIDELSLDTNDVLALLQSDVLNLEAKSKVISAVEEGMVVVERSIVLTIMGIIIHHPDFVISDTLLMNMLQSGYLNAEDRITLFCIKQKQVATDGIADFLNRLGWPYTEVTIPGKRPLLVNNQINYDLLTILESKRYISSFSVQKEGLRVNTLKSKNED